MIVALLVKYAELQQMPTPQAFTLETSNRHNCIQAVLHDVKGPLCKQFCLIRWLSQSVPWPSLALRETAAICTARRAVVAVCMQCLVYC